MSKNKSISFNNTPENTKLSVAFILLPDFTLYTFSGFIDSLRLAADELDRSRQNQCCWTILGPDKSAVRSSCGVEVIPWKTFKDVSQSSKKFDYLVVVGGLIKGHQKIDHRIIDYLQQAGQKYLSIIGICTGSFALARAGLMKSYKSCIHWGHLADFRKEFPDHKVETDSLYIVDRNRITCPGGQSAVDVAFHIIERSCGRAKANSALSGMMIESARELNHPQPHTEAEWFTKINNKLVKRAILIMEQFIDVRTSIHNITTQLNVSVSTLERAFDKTIGLSPANFQRILRVSHGHWEIKHTDKSVTNIALDFGFSDASHFIHIYRKYYGITPAQTRRNFTAAPDEETSLNPTNQPPLIQDILQGHMYMVTEEVD